jgi:hypothetical protein
MTHFMDFIHCQNEFLKLALPFSVENLQLTWYYDSDMATSTNVSSNFPDESNSYMFS